MKYEIWAFALKDDFSLDEYVGEKCIGTFDTLKDAENRFDEISEKDIIEGAAHTEFNLEVVEEEEFGITCTDIDRNYII